MLKRMTLFDKVSTAIRIMAEMLNRHVLSLMSLTPLNWFKPSSKIFY